VRLGTAHAGGKMRPIGAQAVQRDDGGSTVDALGITAAGPDGPAPSACQHAPTPPASATVGIGQGRALHRTPPVIEPRRVARQTATISRKLEARQLAIKHRRKCPFVVSSRASSSAPCFFRQRLKRAQGSASQVCKRYSDAHGVDPRSCLKRRQTLGHQ